MEPVDVKPRLNQKLPAGHLNKVFSARMEDDFKEQVDGWIKSNGLTTKQATQFAFELAMKNFPKIEPK